MPLTLSLQRFVRSGIQKASYTRRLMPTPFYTPPNGWEKAMLWSTWLPLPGGGIALAAVSSSTSRDTPSHFVAQEFPSLSDAFVEDLIETHLGTRKGHIIGGFDCAQQNNAYEL